jgi:hypothetical protein
MGLAHFYHNLDCSGKVLDQATLNMVVATMVVMTATNVEALQGAMVMTSDAKEHQVLFGLGYQLVAFDKSSSGIGHSGVGGSIGLHHPESGLLSIGFMTNKADGGAEVTALRATLKSSWQKK